MRVLNAVIWLGLWLYFVISYNSFGDWYHMFGEAFIPAIIGIVIDLGLRRKRPKISN
jgi:hypothetical protein